MSQKEITWRNHYVPQFILKHFLDYSIDKKGKIHICDKTLDLNQKIDLRNTDTTGYMEHLYTIEDSNGIPIDIIEKYLTDKVDTPMSKIVEKIINNNHILLMDYSIFRSLNFNQTELDIMINFFAHQNLRTPSHFHMTGQIIHSIDSLKAKNLGNIISNKKIFKTDELIPHIFNKRQLQEHIKQLKLYDYFLVINPFNNFLLGDTGVVHKTFVGLLDNEIYFPLSPRILILGKRKKNSLNSMIFYLNKNYNINDLIANLNTSTLQDSHQFVYSHRQFKKEQIQLICSYMSPKFSLDGKSFTEISHKAKWKKNKF